MRACRRTVHLKCFNYKFVLRNQLIASLSQTVSVTACVDHSSESTAASGRVTPSALLTAALPLFGARSDRLGCNFDPITMTERRPSVALRGALTLALAVAVYVHARVHVATGGNSWRQFINQTPITPAWYVRRMARRTRHGTMV